jgi:hypothetical protein
MRTFMMIVAAALLPETAVACTRLTPFETAQLTGAELVLVGKVTGYDDRSTPAGTALVTVQVDTVLKGSAAGKVVLVWSTAGLAHGPHADGAEGRVLIGAMAGGRIAGGDGEPDIRPDLPAIVQPICGEAWIRPATPELLAEVRAVVAP